MTSFAKSVSRLVAVLLAVTMTACTGGGRNNAPNPTPTGTPHDGGAVSFAMKTPTWILPISAPGKTQGENGILQQALYRPLFQYKLGSSTPYSLDMRRSLAGVPRISPDGRTYTITLRGDTWSDGRPLSTRDVEFWWNLVRVNKAEWASYREGMFPDNVASFHVVDSRTFTITTRTKYSPAWYVDNQLSKITPLPQHVWDKASAGGAVSDLDRSAAGSKQVFAYLTEAAKSLSTYGTNPLWRTTSGPFTLKSYVPNGNVVLARNLKYSGQDRAHLDTVTFAPFTSDDSQFNVLRSGGVDYGYIPAASLSQRGYIQSKGYHVEPWTGWSISYVPFNFNNPRSGPIFAQKYIRQAMQHLVDEPNLSRIVWQGAATPTCGPVPKLHTSANDTKGCAYPFDPDRARALLESHGWRINPDGVSICQRPGTGPGQCGRGIAAGAGLSFTLVSQSGFAATSKMMEVLKSQFSEVGINLTIQEVPDSVAVTQACARNDPKCSWDMSFFGSQSSWYYSVYPSGERLFETGAPVNLGSYSDRRADELIEATTTSSDPRAMKEYDDYLSKDLPVLWMPNPVAQTSAWRASIVGISPQDPMLALYPQDWRLTS